MTLYDAFSRNSPNKVFASIVLGALAGIAYALLIPIVLNSLPTESGVIARGVPVRPDTFLGLEVSNIQMAALFLSICLFILFARSTSQIVLLRVSMDIASELRLKIYRRIGGTPIVFLERMGASRLIAVLTTDVNRIVIGARSLPDLLISIVTLTGMLGFLLYMNIAVFWFVMGAILFGAVSYQIPLHFGKRYFIRSRAATDELQESVRGLIHGAKELKLNNVKRASFFRESLEAHEAEIRKSDKLGYTIVRASMNYGDLISFFVIGAIAFVFVNYRAVTHSELLGVIMALLYVTGPVANILNNIPPVLLAKVSLRKVNGMLAELPEEPGADGQCAPVAWSVLRFSGVQYQHQGADGAGFKVGPIDLEIARGEVTFIVGGNGSGKSTLSKLITLHYVPTDGVIAFGETTVDMATLASCRQQIGAIFTDYYLFDRLLGVADQGLQQRIDAYLVALRLAHKVTVKDGRFSTLALSDGQKKRLALLVALLDDKSLYLFDEWAADQDSTFKDVFYNTILPDLKAMNKAVVVISHDDRYFDVADKVLVMEEGRLVRVERRPSAVQLA
ncbi:cyclic peptide export ABC transporter [Massilia pseudoviolaceinigra]|uniref:cyclic peptide export ABC transporter n=1 Tax=Massilia pseudoviolaceinigra TaxID=3057165 RepID=UPI0027967F86|nr:cyclic peptide export ABC transporter [Massilia sp. CCM 9206]MDQ1919131.1 cyclic peptide export ABC transporter [Massilia sp. CCM 9206]